MRDDLDNLKSRFKEACFHMLIHMVIWALFIYSLLFFIQNTFVSLILAMLSLIGFILMIRKNPNEEQLVAYSWICLISIILFGSSIGRFFNTGILVGAIIGISIVDAFSFTKFGKKTPNAKLMNSNKWLSKLIVYGRSFKTKKPIATKGFGDYLWYSITFSAVYTMFGKTAGFYSIIAIITGVIINLIIISQIYKYKWYKGFPATTIPLGLCIVVIVIFSM